MVEFGLLCPWYIFLFIGAFDFGFYSYSLIATQTAARVAGLYCAASLSAASDSTTACSYSLDQLRNMPNVGSGLTTCASAPLVVTAALVTGPDGNNATSVTVAYTTPNLIPIPGILAGHVTISRTVKMKLRS
jgi:Flp pilus assembly protein TadG